MNDHSGGAWNLKPWLFRAGLALLPWLAALPVFGQADHDDFSRRLPLTGSLATTEIHLLNATREPGEPDDERLRGGTLWYSWTAPAEGMLRLSTAPWDPIGGPALVLFSGDRLDNLQAQAPLWVGVGLVFRVHAGVAYAIAAGASAPVVGLTAPVTTLGLEFAELPSNDAFAGRLPLDGDTLEFRAWLGGATLGPGEPSLEPNGQLPTLWWKWVAPASGLATLEVLEGVAWAGAFTSPQPGQLNPVGLMPHPQTPATFEVHAGTEYAIAVTSPGADPNLVRLRLARWMFAEGVVDGVPMPQPATVDFTLSGIQPADVVTNLVLFAQSSLGVFFETNELVAVHLAEVIAGSHRLEGEARCANGRRYTLFTVVLNVVHPNDDFGSRLALSGDPVEFDVDTRGATLDPGETAGGAASVWWSWTAPFTGLAAFTRLSGADVSLGLFEGTSASTLLAAEGNAVVAGRPYAVRALSWTGAVGRYRLQVIQRPTPNDAFASRTVLTVTDLWALVDLGSATAEPGEPAAGAGADKPSVWYSFTAPSDGTIEFGGSGHQLGLVPYLYPPTVFRGSELASLEPVPSFDGFALYAASAGVTYQLRLQLAFPGGGDIPWMRFRFAPTPSNNAFDARTLLTSDHESFRATLEGSTVEAGEMPTARGYVPARSRWWSWKPPRSGWAALHAPEGGANVNFWPFLLEVFEGDSLGGLTPVPLTDLEWEARFFPAEATKTYVIRLSDLAGEYGLGTNSVLLGLDLSDLEIASPAANESFRLPQLPVFTVRGGAAAGSEVTVSYREQVGWAGGGIWDGIVMVEERGTGLGANHAFVPGPLSPGPHRVFATAIRDGVDHDFSAPVTFVIRPANDDFEVRETVVGPHARVPGSTSGSTVEAGEPLAQTASADLSVWYTWTAPADGPVTIRALGENYVRAYRGTSLTSLTDANPAAALGATETLSAARGETYQISVSSVSSVLPGGHALGFTFYLDQTTLQWTSPATNAAFVQGEPILLSLTTTERPEEIARLVFQAGSTTLFAGPVPPFEFVWTNAVPGTHTLRSWFELTSGEVVSNTSRNIRVRTPNTNVLTALPLAGSQGFFAADLRGADRDPGSQQASGWFRWLAPADGYLLVQTTNRNSSSLGVQFSVGDQPQPLTILPTIGSMSLRGWIATKVTNGVNYNLRISGSAGLLLPTLLYELFEPPANDAFLDAESLDGGGFDVRIRALAATAEAGEPVHGNKAPARSVWYRWTAPAKGLLSLTRVGAAAVYTGDSLAALQRIAGTPSSAVHASVEAGVNYRIAIDESTGNTPDLNWHLGFSPAPGNDAFADRFRLEGRRARFQASLSLATGETGEPQPDGYTFGHTVWWTWTAPASGRVDLHSSPAARMAVYHGPALADLTLVALGVWDVSFEAVVGEIYQIMIDTNGGAGPGASDLNLIQQHPAANDAFATRQRLAGRSVLVNGWNIAAHREYREPRHAGQTGGRSVWYAWSAPASGSVRLTVSGDVPAVLLGVYTGDTLPELQPAASASGASDVALLFNASAGQEYVIAVDGALGAAGDFTLALEQEEAVAPTLTVQATVDGEVRIVVEGLAGRGGRLETATALEDWLELLPIPTGMDRFEHGEPASAGSRFFRVVQSP